MFQNCSTASLKCKNFMESLITKCDLSFCMHACQLAMVKLDTLACKMWNEEKEFKLRDVKCTRAVVSRPASDCMFNQVSMSSPKKIEF